MKGDKVVVWYRLGDKASQHTITAEKAGQTISIDKPKGSNGMWEFSVLNKAENPVAVHSFAQDAVIAIIDERKEGDG